MSAHKAIYVHHVHTRAYVYVHLRMYTSLCAVLHKLHPFFTWGTAVLNMLHSVIKFQFPNLQSGIKEGMEWWSCFRVVHQYQHIKKSVSLSLTGVSREAGKKMLPHICVWVGRHTVYRALQHSIFFGVVLFFFFIAFHVCNWNNSADLAFVQFSSNN